MKYYDFKKAKAFIDSNKENIREASLGMDEDWFWTAETVFENGEYLCDLEEEGLDIAGIGGSYWATPTLEVVYSDGTIEKYNCYIGESESDGNPNMSFLQGEISREISALRAAVPRKELGIE